jgi:UPF0755 protein
MISTKGSQKPMSFLVSLKTMLCRVEKYPTRLLLGAVVLGLIFGTTLYINIISAPDAFPHGTQVAIEEGMTLKDAARHLEGRNVIRSPFFFEMTMRFVFGGTIVAGEYFFKEPLTLLGVTPKVARGAYGLTPLKVVIPEGTSVREMAEIISKNFENFDANEFISIAERDEGYLFPDTYQFLPTVKAPQVYSDMKANFEKKTSELKKEIAVSERSLHEIITMASILEEEARRTQTRRMISGILWKRLEIDMPLQVDAVFPYINGKNTFELTLDDLDIDSPYNTYRYRGLPPTPITNPGLDSILAALTPEESPYLYYLADLEGETHYSETFEGHKIKKARYLR